MIKPSPELQRLLDASRAELEAQDAIVTGFSVMQVNEQGEYRRIAPIEFYLDVGEDGDAEPMA